MKKLSATLLCLLASNSNGQSNSQTITNPNYNSYIEPTAIKRDLSGLGAIYRQHYTKFMEYFAPNGGKILLVATREISDEQLLRAYNILEFYLTDVPDSKYGSNKREVANHMANSGAVLVLPGGSDGNSPISQSALLGQPLYQLEFPTEGSPAYINNDYSQRDAGFEEIFHMVHDHGIGTRSTNGALKTSYQSEISKAMQNSLDNSLWGNGDQGVQSWLAELRAEGSLEQEYIASVIDSYYGLWGAWNEGQGGMWGVYVAKTREEVKQKDPQGAALIPQFLPDQISYMARIDPSFSGTFEMAFDTSKPYTHKSQYLLNARLLGANSSNLSGNAHDNVLIGNSANNIIDGRSGNDVVQYPVSSSNVTISKTKGGLTIEGDTIGKDTLKNIEILRFTDRDISVIRGLVDKRTEKAQLKSNNIFNIDLETPSATRTVSGVVQLRGWFFDEQATFEDENLIKIQINDQAKINIEANEQRSDVSSAMGRPVDNKIGWSLLFYSGSLANGKHRIRLYNRNDELLIDREFYVYTANSGLTGERFIKNVDVRVEVNDFPTDGEQLTLKFNQAEQSFTAVDQLDSNNNSRKSETLHYRPDGLRPISSEKLNNISRTHIESPSANQIFSGVSSLRGWSYPDNGLDMQNLFIQIDELPLVKAIRGKRPDVSSAMGIDVEHKLGWSLLYYAGNLSNGKHRIRVFDGNDNQRRLLSQGEFTSFSPVNSSGLIHYLNKPNKTQRLDNFLFDGNNVEISFDNSSQSFKILSQEIR